MGTQLTYNDIDLGEIKTKTITATPMYDQSGRDILFYRYTIDVQSIVYVSADLTNANPSVDALKNNPTQLMDYIYHRLMEPRKYLHFTVDGETLFESKPLAPAFRQLVPNFSPDSNLDADYGPTPLECTITQLYAASYIINYRIVFSDGLCEDDQTRLYASHKYSTNVKFDQSGYKTATTSGRVVVNSDMRINPASLSSLVVPPVLQGYVRSGMFEMSEDGLTLTYVITDQQMHTLPPLGATEAEGTFKVKSQPPGAIMYGQASVRLKGPPQTNRAELLRLAILICLDKIERSGAKTLKDAGGNIIPPIAGIELSESMYDSEVSCSIEAMLFNNRALDANPGGLFNAAEWVGENLFAGSVELIYNAMSSEEDNASIVQDSLQIANKTSKSPSINKKQVATQLSAFGTTPVGSTPPGTGFVNKTELSGTPFEQMVFAKFFTPCSASEGQGVARLRSIDLVNGTALQTGVSEVQSGFRSSGSSTNTPSVENISQTPSGPATGSALGSIQPIINTPRQVGPERPRTDLNSARAFAAIGSGLDRFLQQDGAIAQAVTIIDKGKEQTQVDDNEVPGLYTRYAMSIVEQNGDSRVVSRSTQTDGETLAIKFGQPTKGLILVWSATKAGFPPEIPTLSDSDQFTYIRSTIDFKNMEIMADNKTPMFTMSGSIWYEYTGSKDYSTSCPPPPWVNIGNNQFLSVVSSKTTALTIADS